MLFSLYLTDSLCDRFAVCECSVSPDSSNVSNTYGTFYLQELFGLHIFSVSGISLRLIFNYPYHLHGQRLLVLAKDISGYLS